MEIENIIKTYNGIIAKTTQGIYNIRQVNGEYRQTYTPNKTHSNESNYKKFQADRELKKAYIEMQKKINPFAYVVA